MKKILLRMMTCIFIATATVTLAGSPPSYADTTEAGTYGGGDYGSCTYGSCTITLTSGGNVNLDITPSGTGKCTVHSDTVAVETGNSAGYTLTMTVDAPGSGLTGTSGTIPAFGATAASPASLGMNTWGYRVDGAAGFGSGPATAQDNAAVPSVTFAGVPPNTDAGTAVASSSVAASPAENTTVWYGACANATKVAGVYAATVLYTAVAN